MGCTRYRGNWARTVWVPRRPIRSFSTGPLCVAVTGFETQQGSRGRVGQRTCILQPNPQEFISSRGCPRPASWARTKDVACWCGPSGCHRVSKVRRCKSTPQLTRRPPTAHLYTAAPVRSQLQPTRAWRGYGHNLPKRWELWSPLSDRSCLNLERKESFYYPLPAANI